MEHDQESHVAEDEKSEGDFEGEDEDGASGANGITHEVEGNNLDNLDSELNNLREIFRRKQEILKLKKQLSVLCDEKEYKGNQGQSFNFKDTENSMPNFTGDDNLSIERWVSDFEENSIAFGRNDKMKVIYAKRLMSGKAKLFLRTNHATTWSDLKFKLLKEFEDKISSADVHQKLRTRRKRSDETLHQYVLAMQEIAFFGNIHERDIVQYVIAGIPDNESNKVTLYQANTLNDLKLVPKKYETMKTNQNNFTAAHSYHNSNSTKGIQNQKYQTCNNNQVQGHNNSYARNLKCFNAYGHVAMKCKPRRVKGSCFDCNSQDHMIGEYPNEIMNIVNRNNTVAQTSVTSDEHETSIKYINEFMQKINYKFYNNESTSADEEVYSTNLMILFDSGSPISFIQKQYVPSVLINEIDSNKYNFKDINNSRLNIIGQVFCMNYFNNDYLSMKLFVVENNSMNNSIILEKNFIKNNKLTLCKNHCNDQDNCQERNTMENMNIGMEENTSFKNGMCENAKILCKDIFNINVTNNAEKITLDINKNLKFNIQNEIYEIVKQILVKKIEDYNGLIDFSMEIQLIKNEIVKTTPRRLTYVQVFELKKLLKI